MARHQEATAAMNKVLKTAVALSSTLMLLSHAQAGPQDTPEATTTSTEPGVVAKAENAVVRGAKAAASGIEHGVQAAASGVERGAKATARGIQRGAKATARGVEHGAKATGNAAGRVADKITPASSPSTGK
jgi:hypothetical protein